MRPFKVPCLITKIIPHHVTRYQTNKENLEKTLTDSLEKNIIPYHLFSFCKSLQDYIIHMDMEIVIFLREPGDY